MSFNENIETFTKYLTDEGIIPIIVIGSLVTFVVYEIYSLLNDENIGQNFTKYFYYKHLFFNIK
jgi:predicted nucleotide-binding protein (sugar kinase/HSP70/actin superfamily)